VLELKVHDGDREVVLQFEHSLLSLSKWEAKNKKAFLATPTKPHGELIDYFQYMLLNPEEGQENVYRLSPGQMDELSNYINDSQTASSVPLEDNPRKSGEIVTSELIYAWLALLKIPFHPTETWHINRIMMLVSITNYKLKPEEKKKSRGDFMKKWHQQQAQLKDKFGTSG
jgi:hypothetical protein